MKANEAPEKLYVNFHFIETHPWSHQPLVTKQGINKYDIEYTRTDYAKKRFIVDAKIFLSEIHRVCDITDENGYRIKLRDLQTRFENYMKGE